MVSVGDIALAVIAVSCILSISYFIFGEPKSGKSSEAENETRKSNNSIVGISHTKLGQYTDSLPKNRTNKRLVIPPEEMEQAFYTNEEARLNIDVDMEGMYSMGELQDEEDLYLFEDSELAPALASGAGFEELAEMSVTIQSQLNDLPFSQIMNTGQTIETVENTDLLGQLVSQVENGEQKVADILDRCEAELKEPSQSPPNNDGLEGFDLGRWL
jgi:hypothetical protein